MTRRWRTSTSLLPLTLTTLRAYNGRGMAYGSMDEDDKAIADFGRAIAIDPNNADVYHNRGFTYSVLGEYAKAIADYDRAIAIDPNDADVYNSRASAHEALGNTSQAQADMQKFRDLSGE